MKEQKSFFHAERKKKTLLKLSDWNWKTLLIYKILEKRKKQRKEKNEKIKVKVPFVEEGVVYLLKKIPEKKNSIPR
jgi:hypothetical protein